MKICKKCGIPKPLSEFYKKTSAKDKLQSSCKSCHNLITLAWDRKNPKKRADYHRFRKYGLRPEQYKALLLAQQGVCFICGSGRSGQQLTVDHDHVTGKIRGLLCHGHNLGIEKFDDSPDQLRRAADYLEKKL